MSISWLSRGAQAAERARWRMYRTGATPNGHPLWDQFEVGNMVEHHPHYDVLEPLLCRRTRRAQYAKAGRLGVTRRHRVWDENEVPRLRKMYPTATPEALLAAFPGRTLPAIRSAAQKRGFQRSRKPYALSGILVIDRILTRATELNMNLSDLDALGGKAGYFSRRRWRYGILQMKPVGLVVKSLGGELRVRWNGTPLLPARRLPRVHGV